MRDAKKFSPGVAPPESLNGPSFWFAFRKTEMLVVDNGSGSGVPLLDDVRSLQLDVSGAHYLGRLGDRHCFAAALSDDAAEPEGMAFKGLRKLYEEQFDERMFRIAGRAVQIVEWDRTHRYCGRCGAMTEAKETERAMACPECGLLQFPRVSPAIIVLVERGDQVLLARSPWFISDMFSVLAGFAEPGETLEETVKREVKEEVNIDVKDITYFASQPWPFPHSLMIGFTAKYAGGEIERDPSEIEEAGWFGPDNLPPRLPGKISIARKLIDWYIEKHSDEGHGKAP